MSDPLTQCGPHNFAMAGVLICSALEAYERDWKAIHFLWIQLVICEIELKERFAVLADREAIASRGTGRCRMEDESSPSLSCLARIMEVS